MIGFCTVLVLDKLLELPTGYSNQPMPLWAVDGP